MEDIEKFSNILKDFEYFRDFQSFLSPKNNARKITQIKSVPKNTNFNWMYRLSLKTINWPKNRGVIMGVALSFRFTLSNESSIPLQVAALLSESS